MTKAKRQRTIDVTRSLFLGFNVLMAVLAFMLIVYSTINGISPEDFYNNIELIDINDPGWLFIISIFLLALGLIAIYDNSSFLLIGYLVFLVFVFMYQVILEYKVVHSLPEIKQNLGRKMKLSMMRYWTNEEPWNFIQEKFQCCGTDSPKDWYKILGNYTLSSSCCVNSTDVCLYNSNSENVYQIGCVFQVISNLTIGIIVGIAITVSQFFSIILAAFMIYALWKQSHGKELYKTKSSDSQYLA